METEFSLIDIAEAGTALANSTTATSLMPTGRTPTLPSNYFDRIGKRLRVEFWGRISNIVTTPGTLTLDVRLGTISPIVVWNGGAMNLNTTAKTNVPWRLWIDMTSAAIGAGTTAALLGLGNFQSESLVGSAANSAGGNGSLLLPVGNPANGTGFSSEDALQLRLYATWSIANSGNSIQMLGGRVSVWY